MFKLCESPISLTLREAMLGCFVGYKFRVVRIPQDKRELSAAVPIVRDLLFREVFQVEGAVVGIVLAKGEEKNTPN